MKVKAHDNKLETNSESESKEFGIGDASVVIDILRNRLYENKIQTLVQEYICNARDAMREVGKGNDFQVTLPTRLSPTFKVRDFGPGISPDRMDKVFRLYGASTKRGTNNQTGGFGIGAKSAWSYTDSFSVVTIVDGKRRSYVCHTGTNNQGSLDLVSTDDTDEANGTEIQIAVERNDISEFHSAAYRATYFWDHRPRFNETDTVPSLVSGYKVSDNLEVIDRNMIPGFIGLEYHAKALAVIDGVPYPLTEKLLNKAVGLKKLIESSVKKTIILHFGNGLVEVSASRESIADSQFSVNALNKMGTKAGEVIIDHVKAEFAKVNSTELWIKTYGSLSPYFNVDKHSKYGDYNIVDGEIVSENFQSIHMTIAHCLDKRGRHRVERLTKEEVVQPHHKTIPIEMINKLYVVTQEETAVIQNKRLRHLFNMGSNSPFTKAILLKKFANDDGTMANIIKDLGLKTLEDVEYPVIPKAEKVKIEREKTEFCMHSFTGTRHTYTSLSTNSNKYLYVEIGEGNWEGYDQSKLRSLSWHLKEHYDLQIVGLADKAVKTAKGDPNFTPFRDWIATFEPKREHINYAIASQAKNMSNLEGLMEINNFDQIKDEFMKEMIKEYKLIRAGKRKIVQIPDMLIEKVKESVNAKDFFDKDEKLFKLLSEKYPLVMEIGQYANSSIKNELAFYINAKYTN